ncbi:hypothetical protein [Nonomuraea sp. NPDC050783]
MECLIFPRTYALYGEEIALLDLVPFRVTPGPAFHGDIKALLGAASIGGA